MARGKKTAPVSPNRLVLSIVCASLVGVFLLIIRIQHSESTRYLFLIWNLILAGCVPLIAWWLTVRIRKYGWLKTPQILLTFTWFLFLPNSFYIITDFIHLRPNYEASLLFDIVMLTSFTLSGLVLGYISVYMVHEELKKRMSARSTWVAISGIFVASSFAIYLGRFTRWNSWDIILQPAGLLFDVSDRVVNPAAHGQTYVTTVIFSILLIVFYWVTWESIQFLKAK